MTIKTFNEADRMDCYAHNWRRKTPMTDCRTCEDHETCYAQRPVTPGEAFDDLFYVVCEEFGIRRLLDWLTAKMS